MKAVAAVSRGHPQVIVKAPAGGSRYTAYSWAVTTTV